MITEQEYWDEVRAIAKTVKEEAEGRELADVLHEAVDSHEWIIYTAQSVLVLYYSPNDNAYFEEIGQFSASCFSDTVQQLAFFALYADVQEALNDL